MARQRMTWFRMYVEIFSDPKVRGLAPVQRWLLAAVFGAARQSPVPGVLLIEEDLPMDDEALADFAGVPVREVTRAMPIFEHPLKMITRDVGLGAWRVTNWDRRQHESDVSTERTAKHRSKERQQEHGGGVRRTPSEVRGQNSELLTSSLEGHEGRRGPPDDDLTPAIFEAAVDLLAHRDLEARNRDKGPVQNRGGWLTTARKRRRAEFEEAALALLAVTPGLDPEKLADLLHPSDELSDGVAEAFREQARRNGLAPCSDCDNTGWRGGDPAQGKCSCGRLLDTAAAPV